MGILLVVFPAKRPDIGKGCIDAFAQENVPRALTMSANVATACLVTIIVPPFLVDTSVGDRGIDRDVSSRTSITQIRAQSMG
jgi:hypothetical protein